MDLRIEKTRRGIINAFLALRARKPLEKITVKDLCQGAQIHKSTFYAHFADLYALSDELETQVVESVLGDIPHPEDMISRPGAFTQEFFRAYQGQASLIRILFSGSRQSRLIEKLEAGLGRLLRQRYPELGGQADLNLVLRYIVYGGYYAYVSSPDPARAVDLISRLAESALAQLDRESDQKQGDRRP